WSQRIDRLCSRQVKPGQARLNADEEAVGAAGLAQMKEELVGCRLKNTLNAGVRDGASELPGDCGECEAVERHRDPSYSLRSIAEERKLAQRNQWALSARRRPERYDRGQGQMATRWKRRERFRLRRALEGALIVALLCGGALALWASGGHALDLGEEGAGARGAPSDKHLAYRYMTVGWLDWAAMQLADIVN